MSDGETTPPAGGATDPGAAILQLLAQQMQAQERREQHHAEQMAAFQTGMQQQIQTLQHQAQVQSPLCVCYPVTQKKKAINRLSCSHTCTQEAS